MKVWFINSNKVWGGGEKWHFDIAYALKTDGFEVTLMAFPGRELYIRSERAGIRTIPVVISNLSFLNFFLLFRLIRLFKYEKPDAVILNLSPDVKTAGIAAKIAGIRNIVYRRGIALAIRNTLLNRFIFRFVITAVIANSEETKRTINGRNNKMFPTDNISVIYNGIDLVQFDKEDFSPAFKRKEDRIYIGTAGRLETEKNHRMLLYVLKILKNKGLKCSLVIAGTGSLEDELKQLAEKEDIADVIEFTGFIEPIKAFMHCIDIFVLPSLFEGFGFVKIEAMASSKPVVAFNSSSNPEIIIDNETGFLVDDNNPYDLAGKIQLLVENEALREKMGEKGRIRVEELFTMKQALSNIKEFLFGLNKKNNNSYVAT
ncbi:MAG: glycosyltransferase family 4 protein [Bacteroidales bacterium]|nr:glycosyltransferase family 4 protein [Bacteroidales bacterium]